MVRLVFVFRFRWFGLLWLLGRLGVLNLLFLLQLLLLLVVLLLHLLQLLLLLLLELLLLGFIRLLVFALVAESFAVGRIVSVRVADAVDPAFAAAADFGFRVSARVGDSRLVEQR